MKSMRLIESSWGDKKTFKMIPISTSCTYTEAIFDMDSKILAVIGTIKKQTFHMIPKLTDAGDVEEIKDGRKRKNGKNYKEERKAVETFTEYYIESKQDILDFIETFADNAHKFKIEPYFQVTTQGFGKDAEISTIPSIIVPEGTIEEESKTGS